MGNLTFEDGRLVGKRGLRFEAVEDMITEAEALLADGYDMVGEWTLGQNCEHLRMTLEKSVSGFGFELGFPMNLVVKMVVSKGKIFREGFKPGFKLKGRFKVMIPSDGLDDGEEVAKLREAVEQFKGSATTKPSPVLGAMSFDDWNLFHMRHAEHHLGMLRPKPKKG
ncbi:DUF1569 domain-containing protein [Planctomycetota bacterium]|nr:DUF1569 domain-containing protein [Planctomycetota bacterium]